MISVSELNEKIKAVLETTFMHIIVEGEVSSATYHSSGHLYFSLKDETSTIKCVMWRSSVRKLKFKVQKGEHIVIDGSVGVYSPRGEYQFIAVNIEPFGKGALALAYEQLKKKLEAKGYFDKEHKKQLPKVPQKIAVVTALNSAAWQDVLKVATKRWPMVELKVIDVLVQGQSAALEIAKAIGYADSLDVDAILVTRGGGSAEDLWAFNEEVVADAIYNATKPVVSAVGHEVDFLISDFVADVRAPTPSAAVETLLPDRNEYLFLLGDMYESLNKLIIQKIDHYNQAILHLSRSLKMLSPNSKMNFFIAEFEGLKKRLNEVMGQKLLAAHDSIAPIEKRLDEIVRLQLRKSGQELKIIKEQLLLNNPQSRVKSGFVELTKSGKRVELCSLQSKDTITLVSDKCKVEAVVLNNPSTF